VGQPAVDGDLQFIVNGVRRAPSIPDKYNPETPQGEFFIVDLTVSNVGVQQAEYGSQYQKLIVSGEMLAYADMATYKLTDESISRSCSISPSVLNRTALRFMGPVRPRVRTSVFFEHVDRVGAVSRVDPSRLTRCGREAANGASCTLGLLTALLTHRLT
jgi:hypothetical protein